MRAVEQEPIRHQAQVATHVGDFGFATLFNVALVQHDLTKTEARECLGAVLVH